MSSFLPEYGPFKYLSAVFPFSKIHAKMAKWGITRTFSTCGVRPGSISEMCISLQTLAASKFSLNLMSSLLNHSLSAVRSVRSTACEAKTVSRLLPKNKHVNFQGTAAVKEKVNRCAVSRRKKNFSGIITSKINNKLTVFTPLPCSDATEADPE